MSKAVSRFIDTVRWIAALVVALHHTNNLFINQADIMRAPHAAPVYVWWFLTPYTFAHGAVVVFFVLSGFLVGGIVVERARGHRAFLRNYFIDRTTRIYIVLVPALALTFLLDNVGRRVFGGLGVYEQSFLTDAFRPEWLATTLVSLQGIWFRPYGTNVPMWSLGIEFWYYIVFALLMLPLSSAYSRGARWAAFVAGAAAFAALAAGPSYFLLGSFIWGLGALIRIAPRPLLRSKWLALLLWIGVMVAIRLLTHGAITTESPRRELVDGANALLFANLLLTLRFDQGEGFSLCRWRWHAKLSDFSYTLYATHLPILMWLWGLSAIVFGADWRTRIATPAHYAWAIGSLAALVLLSFGISRLTEANTGALRTWARRVAPGEPARPRAAN